MKEVVNFSIVYEYFASLSRYPDNDLQNDIRKTQIFIERNYPTASSYLLKFYNISKSIPLTRWQEIYTRTFDVQAITTLDIGYVLFGDDYKRGDFLVHLSEEHKKANNDCGTELADHLPNLLKLLNKLNDDDLKNDLICFFIKPALQKILKEFEKEEIEKKNLVYQKHHKTLLEVKDSYFTLYQSLIQALLEIFRQDYPNDQHPVQDSKTFTKEITNELEIQD